MILKAWKFGRIWRRNLNSIPKASVDFNLNEYSIFENDFIENDIFRYIKAPFIYKILYVFLFIN